MKRFTYVIIILVLVTFTSCSEKPIANSEGTIEFNVTYPKMDKNNYMLKIMPKTMTLNFQHNRYTTRLSAGMGTFQTNFIFDKEEEQFTQLVKMVNKKYAVQLEGEDIFSSINSLPKFHVKETNEVKKILGYKCKKAIVTVDDQKDQPFTVFYTDQININDPNWCNQFSAINGVLLEYQYEKYGICMRFEADKIKFKKIKDTEFDIPENYKFVSMKEIDKEMTEIFESFN